jgi:hypothetical protein
MTFESRHRLPGAKARTARASELEGKATRFEPAVTLAKPGVDDIIGQVGKSAAGFRPIEQLDIRQPPLALGLDLPALGSGTVVGLRDEQVTLVAKSKIDTLLQIVEEVDTFTDQRHFIRVVELQPKGAGGDRGGQRRQRGAFFEDDRLESGAFGEKRGGTTDDAPADDDEVGGIGR